MLALRKVMQWNWTYWTPQNQTILQQTPIHQLIHLWWLQTDHYQKCTTLCYYAKLFSATWQLALLNFYWLYILLMDVLRKTARSMRCNWTEIQNLNLRRNSSHLLQTHCVTMYTKRNKVLHISVWSCRLVYDGQHISCLIFLGQGSSKQLHGKSQYCSWGSPRVHFGDHDHVHTVVNRSCILALQSVTYFNFSL